jgi:hypothetical protein
MPITPDEVKVGSFYTAGKNQLRQVIAVIPDKDGKIAFVDWAGKSGNPPKNGIPSEGFSTAPNRTNPPSISTFCIACHKRLSDVEVKELVSTGVLTQDESTSVYKIPNDKK